MKGMKAPEGTEPVIGIVGQPVGPAMATTVRGMSSQPGQCSVDRSSIQGA